MDALQADPAQTVIMDALSTAKAMVFLHPHFLSSLAERAQIVLQTMEDDPKLAALATVIETVFPTATNPLANTQVINALREAAQSVRDRLPLSYIQNLATLPQPQPQPQPGGPTQPGISSAIAGLLQAVLPPAPSGEPLPVFLKKLDLYMMKSSIPEPGKLKIEPAGGTLLGESIDMNPVDWLVQMRELNPKQSTFAQGCKASGI